MSRIAYDPVKNRFARIIRDHRFLRTLFYKLLDLFFLRSWYVRDLLNKYGEDFAQSSSWKLLDAGCGFGQYDRFILSEFSGVRVTSVDVKEDYLSDCRFYFKDEIAEDRIKFEVQDLLNPTFSESFEMAICVDVLEHIEEDVRVMKNIRQALNKGGYFIMHSPSIYSEEDAGEEESFVDEHARTGYSTEDLTQKFKQAGLTLVEIGYSYGSNGHLAWKWLIQYPMLWMNKMKLWALPLMAVYYIFTLPVGLILMRLDLAGNNKKGTGIYAVAQKAEDSFSGTENE